MALAADRALVLLQDFATVPTHRPTLQGCGKTTLCEQLQSLFQFTGASAASISIDDFYLTYQGQQAGGQAGGGVGVLPGGCFPAGTAEPLQRWHGISAAAGWATSLHLHLHPITAPLPPCPLSLAVATANPGNPLLQMRGNAGSHDMALGTDTLKALKAATRPGSSVPIPRWAPRQQCGVPG